MATVHTVASRAVSGMEESSLATVHTVPNRAVSGTPIGAVRIRAVLDGQGLLVHDLRPRSQSMGRTSAGSGHSRLRLVFWVSS